MPFKNKYMTSVEWADSDPLGQTFYPNYFRWFDIGTHSLLAAAGKPYDQLITDCKIAGLPLVDAQASFRSRCKWTDQIEVESYISAFGKKSFTVSHNIINGTELAVEGKEIRIWGLFDPRDSNKLKAGLIPEDFRKTFS